MGKRRVGIFEKQKGRREEKTGKRQTETLYEHRKIEGKRKMERDMETVGDLEGEKRREEWEEVHGNTGRNTKEEKEKEHWKRSTEAVSRKRKNMYSREKIGIRQCYKKKYAEISEEYREELERR